MARRQFTIFAAPGYRSEAEDLAVRIRMHNPHSIPLVRVVGTFERLHAELKKEDRTDWLFLFADWVDGKLDYGGQRRSLAELATQWDGTVRFYDMEILRLEGKVTGRKPTSWKRFLRLVGRGTATFEAAWTSPHPFP